VEMSGDSFQYVEDEDKSLSVKDDENKSFVFESKSGVSQKCLLVVLRTRAHVCLSVSLSDDRNKL